MQYSSAARLNDVIADIRHLEQYLYTVSHEEVDKKLRDIRLEIGSILEED